MHVFISGVSGAGLSSLAHLCLDLGYTVTGTDLAEIPKDSDLLTRGLNFHLGQSADFLKNVNLTQKIDYYIHTPALKSDNPEYIQAKQLNIPIGKQNFLINQIIKQKQLKLIAVAGTHGKTTTTAMLVWLFHSLNIPISYIIGSSIPFGHSGQYQSGGHYLIYEADEYDRKFLDLYPEISIITSLDYDHPDTYPTISDYTSAFKQFIYQTNQFTYFYQEKCFDTLTENDQKQRKELLDEVGHKLFMLSLDTNWGYLQKKIRQYFTLPGVHNRLNAFLALQTFFNLHYLNGEFLEYLRGFDTTKSSQTHKLKRQLAKILNSFPSTSRRFERLNQCIFSDYAHHPTEIKATLQLAREYIKLNLPQKKLAIVYQPHQNTRQHQIYKQYKDCLNLADKILWLPTYLTRENPDLPILTPEELTRNTDCLDKISFYKLDDHLFEVVQELTKNNYLVLLLGAGDIDPWFRQRLISSK